MIRAVALAAILPLAGAGLAEALPRALEAGIPAPSAWAVVDGDDVETGGSHGADAGTPFLLGSLAKPFTAAAVLQLVDAGEVALDDPVAAHLPGFRAADPDPITIGQLLRHESGLSPVAGLDATHDPALTLPDRVAGAEHAERTAVGFAYSNLNYALAAAVVERVTGRPYADHLAESLLAPLGMRATTADPDVAADTARRGHLVALGLPVPHLAETPRAGAGDGYLVSTAADVARFLRMLLDDGRAPDGSRVLSVASVDLMLSAHVDAPDAAAPGTVGYGLGWGVGTAADGSPMAAHVGSTATFTSAAALLPDAGRAVVVLSAANGWFYDTTGAYREALAALGGPVSAPAEPPALTAALLAGTVLLAIAVVAAGSLVRRRRDARHSVTTRRRMTRATLDATGAAALPLAWFAGAGSAFTGRPFPLDLALSASVELTVLAVTLGVALAVRAAVGLARLRPRDRSAA